MAEHRDRRLREARAGYLAAVRRLDAALRAFDESGMPMDPGPDMEEPYPWTAEQIRIISANHPTRTNHHQTSAP